MTKTTTYKRAVTDSLGEGWGKALGIATTLKTFAACLMYSIIIGDSVHSLAGTFGLTAALPALAARWRLLSATTALVLTPLCLLRSFALLGYTSLLGIAGTAYTVVVMGLRCFDGTYARGGVHHTALVAAAQAKGVAAALPSFGSTTRPASAFVLVSMLSTAFIAHYNAPRFYQDLKDRSVKRFAVLTALGFGGGVAFFLAMMSLGFLTFGGSTMGFILNNYASSDGLASAARVAILASMVFGYPLTFVSLRDGVLELAGAGQGSAPVSWRTKDAAGVALLALLTAVSSNLRNLGLVSSVGGAILGSAIIYIFPCLGFLAATQVRLGALEAANDPAAKGLRLERAASRAGIVLGALFAVLGVKVSVGH